MGERVAQFHEKTEIVGVVATDQLVLDTKFESLLKCDSAWQFPVTEEHPHLRRKDMFSKTLAKHYRSHVIAVNEACSRLRPSGKCSFATREHRSVSTE